MRRFEVSIEVGPMDQSTIDAVKSAGHKVYRSAASWRITAEATVISDKAIDAQAHVFVADLVRAFGLPAADEPVYSLRNPDASLDERPELVLGELARQYDPSPVPRPKRKWWQRAMELGLGERKG